MGETIRTGTLEFKNIEFLFVFDGKELTLATPKKYQHEIEWTWFHTEIQPGVYTAKEPPTVDAPFLVGKCSETAKQIIFLTRSNSPIKSRNSTLYIDIVATIEENQANSLYCGMSLSCPELNYIHPISKAFTQEFNLESLQNDGIMTVKTRGFDETTTQRKAFSYEGVEIYVHFSIDRTYNTKNSKQPIKLNSSITFEFEETNDYWFLLRIRNLAKRFIQILTFRQNIEFFEENLLTRFYDGRHLRTATLRPIDRPESSESSLEELPYIRLIHLDSQENRLFSLIAENGIYLRHIPKTYRDGHSIDAATFIMTTAAFEWEFDQTHPSGVKKSESRISAEQRASQELDGLIKKSTGKTKGILRFLRKSIGFDNLESKFLQASSECDSVIGLFGKHLYGINGEEFSYSAIGKRLANQRNDFAHGNIDKEPDSMAILDLLFLRYFILAIQLKRIDVSDASIRKAINELFRLHIALPDTTKEDGS